MRLIVSNSDETVSENRNLNWQLVRSVEELSKLQAVQDVANKFTELLDQVGTFFDTAEMVAIVMIAKYEVERARAKK
jgi:hypothetical protein